MHGKHTIFFQQKLYINHLIVCIGTRRIFIFFLSLHKTVLLDIFPTIIDIRYYIDDHLRILVFLVERKSVGIVENVGSGMYVGSIPFYQVHGYVNRRINIDIFPTIYQQAFFRKIWFNTNSPHPPTIFPQTPPPHSLYHNEVYSNRYPFTTNHTTILTSLI